MYNAFISYSHAADGTLAPALEKALQRFGIPWWKKRVLNIFRDEASLSASPHLWSNISKALDGSEYLIYMASPQSAKSKWVIKEIEYWLTHKSLETLLIALTDGGISWNDRKGNFNNADSNSLPEILENRFQAEPFYIDLRALKTKKEVSQKNPILQKEVLKLAAQLHGKEPKDLASEELNSQRKWILIRNLAFVLLTALLSFSILKTVEANKSANLAIKNEKQAVLNEEKAVKQTKIAVGQTKRAIASSLTASSNFYNQTNSTISFRLAEYALQYDSTSIEGYAALLRAFYSNPHYYEDHLHGNTFYDQENQVVPALRVKANQGGHPHTGWPYGFISSKGIELWGETVALGDVIYSPRKDFVLFYYFPESDNGGYMIELWDLKNRFNNLGHGRWNEEKQEFYDAPIYHQYLSYTQIEGFDRSNFSSDNRYLVVPKDNKALVIEVPYVGKPYYGRFNDQTQFGASGSNSQVLRACFTKSSPIINTIDLKGDTLSYNLSKMALPAFSLRKTSFYSDLGGQYIVAVQGKSATVWNLEGKVLGKATLNKELNGFLKPPDSIQDWEQIKLTKVLSNSYYDSHGFEADTTAISSDGNFKISRTKIKDSLNNRVVSLVGHSEIIRSVDISDNAQMFLTSTCPKIGLPETKLWDYNGNELLSLNGFGGKVGFLPGSKAFYTYTIRCCLECDSDENVKIWPIDKQLLIKWVGKNKIHTLSREEMDRFGIDLTLLSP